MSVLQPGLISAINAMALAHGPQNGFRLRLDAVGDPGTGIYFNRELEHIVAEIYRERLPTLNALRYFPIASDVPAGAERFTHRMVSPIGVAKYISNEADDLPMADISRKEESFVVKTIGASFKYTIIDILNAQMSNMSLDVERGIAVRRAIEEKQNRIFWNGDASVGQYGVLNFPYTPRHVFANAIAAGTAADTIIAELNSFVNTIVTLTKETERPSRLLLATSPYSYIASTPRSATTDTTILQFFLQNNPYIQSVESVHELEGAGTGGTHLTVAYSPEARVGKLVLPQPFTMLPAQQRNLAFVVPAYARIGGFASVYPLAMSIGQIPAS